jgi:hypothetical protein
MFITKKKLERIIAEEKRAALKEAWWEDQKREAYKDLLKRIYNLEYKVKKLEKKLKKKGAKGGKKL